MTEERRTRWSASDLLAATFPEPRWAVPGLIPEGLSLLVGPPKVGKSWVGLALGMASGGGGVAFGTVPVPTGGALVLALEDTARRLQSRLSMMLGDGEPPAGLDLATSWPRIGDGAEDWLDDYLTKRPDCRLVVVDVLAKIRGPVDERGDRYAVDYAAAGALKEVADRHQIALVVLHHQRKAVSDDYVATVSGTHGLAGAADAILMMTRARNSHEALLNITGRDIEESEHGMRFDPAIGQWALTNPVELLGDTRRRILDLLSRGEGMTPKRIADVLGITHDNAKQTVRRMLESHQLDVADGVYLPVTPVTQSLITDVVGDSVTPVTPIHTVTDPWGSAHLDPIETDPAVIAAAAGGAR